MPSRPLKHHVRGRTLTVAFICAATVIAASATAYRSRAQTKATREARRAEAKARMEGTRHHIQTYLRGVYSTILYVSLDPDVRAMTGASRQHIQAVFDHQWAETLLSEVYIIERGFDGTRQPFMTFERGSEPGAAKEEHSLEFEEAEYAAQIAQMARFADEPGVDAQISQPVSLCVREADGSQADGVVCSVPIRSDDELVGIVSGMVSRENIEAELGVGHHLNAAILANDRGEVFGCDNLRAETLAWFRRVFESEGVAQFYAGAADTFEVGEWTTLWTPVDIASETRWWLAFQYPQEAASRGASSGWEATVEIAALGTLLALLANLSFRRLEGRARLAVAEQEEAACVALLGRIVEGQEEERKRIARELHDELGQALTSFMMNTDPGETAGMPAECVAHRKDIVERVQSVIDQVRSMAWRMRPSVLDDYGLESALGRYLDHTADRTGLAIDYEFVSSARDPRLPSDVEVSLYRIAQEAVTNILRHAKATQVNVVLTRRGGETILIVEDDGIGFEPSQTARNGRDSLGLLGMRERAAMVKGEFIVESSPGAGTVIRVRVGETENSDEHSDTDC
ncbi:MAG TPA: sensor histidine kinase [Armatimonadota bacterium]|nr:sensor histidine kinase [Armatimonadota bacterium]